MRIIFMGSADMACACLDRIISSENDCLVGVITQPDRPSGRSRKLSSCPVRSLLANTEIRVLTPTDVNSDESVRAIGELCPDLAVVAAYGQILKERVLAIPPLGCVNVHASLLPRYRGAAPIEWAVARGETITGVTTIFMNASMDAGDIIAQITEPIEDDDTAGSLRGRLTRRAAELLSRTLDIMRGGTAPGTPQVHSEATYAPKLKKSDGRLDWTRGASELHNRVRGFDPRPGCFFERSSGGRVRVFQTRVEPVGEPSALRDGREAGVILEARGAGPLVLTGDRALRLLEVQPDGRKRMSGTSFLCGHTLKAGEILY